MVFMLSRKELVQLQTVHQSSYLVFLGQADYFSLTSEIEHHKNHLPM